jgi:hypothetical protein
MYLERAGERDTIKKIGLGGQPSGQPLTYDILWLKKEDAAGTEN